MANLKEKISGCIHGLAIGDALGATTEFMNLNEIYETFGPEGITKFESISFAKRVISSYHHPIGSYTDDTQMSIATAQALLKSKSTDLEEIMKNIRLEYIAWKNSPENNRAPGETCIIGVENMQAEIDWKKSGLLDSLGCGASMRTAPVGLFFYNDFNKLKEISFASSFCTHANPTAAYAGVGTAYLTALAINNESPENMITWLESEKEFDPIFVSKISQVREVLRDSDHHRAMKELGEGWDGHEAVALALYCFLKNPKDYRKTVLMAANTSGDSDSIACIAGAISGAFNGIKAIPSEYISQVENTQMLEQLSQEIHDNLNSRDANPKSK